MKDIWTTKFGWKFLIFRRRKFFNSLRDNDFKIVPKSYWKMQFDLLGRKMCSNLKLVKFNFFSSSILFIKISSIFFTVHTFYLLPLIMLLSCPEGNIWRFPFDIRKQPQKIKIICISAVYFYIYRLFNIIIPIINSVCIVRKVLWYKICIGAYDCFLDSSCEKNF